MMARQGGTAVVRRSPSRALAALVNFYNQACLGDAVCGPGRSHGRDSVGRRPALRMSLTVALRHELASSRPASGRRGPRHAPLLTPDGIAPGVPLDLLSR